MQKNQNTDRRDLLARRNRGCPKHLPPKPSGLNIPLPSRCWTASTSQAYGINTRGQTHYRVVPFWLTLTAARERINPLPSSPLCRRHGLYLPFRERERKPPARCFFSCRLQTCEPLVKCFHDVGTTMCGWFSQLLPENSVFPASRGEGKKRRQGNKSLVNALPPPWASIWK